MAVEATPAKTKEIPYIGVRKVRGGYKGEITVSGKKVRRTISRGRFREEAVAAAPA